MREGPTTGRSSETDCLTRPRDGHTDANTLKLLACVERRPPAGCGVMPGDDTETMPARSGRRVQRFFPAAQLGCT